MSKLKPYQRRVGGRDRRKYEEVEVEEEGRGKIVQRSKGPRQGSQGPRYLKVTFKYELDSDDGPSCFML